MLLSAWNALWARLYRPAWRIFAFLLMSGLVCLLVGELGVTVDQNGVLHEVGFALPLGGIFFLLGTLGTGLLAVLAIYRFVSKFMVKKERA